MDKNGKTLGLCHLFFISFSGLDITHNGFDADYPFFNFNSEPMLAVDDVMAASLKQDAESMIKEMYADSSR